VIPEHLASEAKHSGAGGFMKPELSASGAFSFMKSEALLSLSQPLQSVWLQ